MECCINKLMFPFIALLCFGSVVKPFPACIPITIGGGDDDDDTRTHTLIS